MISIRETVLSMEEEFKHKETRRAVDIAAELVSNLHDRQYIFKNNVIPTVFVRVDDWSQDLVPESLDLNSTGLIKLSNSTEINFEQSDVDSYLKNDSKCRLVLLSTKGFSSFILER